MKNTLVFLLSVLALVSFGDGLGPNTELNDVPGTSTLKEMFEAGGGGRIVSTNDLIAATNTIAEVKRDKADRAVYSVTQTENTDWTWTSENKDLEAVLNEASVKPIYDSENHFWVIAGTTHWGEFYYNSPGVYDVDALSVSLAFITIPGYVDYTATATRPRYMDEALGPAKPNQQLAAVATNNAAKPADGDLVKYDAANDRFVKAVEGTDYLKTHQDISGKLDKSGGQMTGTLSGGDGFGWIMNRQGESLDDTLGTFPTYLDLDTKVSAAVSTNNPAFVSAVQNTPAPEPGQGEDPPWGTWGTVGAAIAGLVAGLKWLKDKVFDSAGNIQNQFATDLLGKQVAIQKIKEVAAPKQDDDGNFYFEV